MGNIGNIILASVRKRIPISLNGTQYLPANYKFSLKDPYILEALPEGSIDKFVKFENKVIYYANEDVPFGVDLLFKDKKSLAVVGIEICEDLWVPDKPSTHASLRGANIILNLSACRIHV